VLENALLKNLIIMGSGCTTITGKLQSKTDNANFASLHVIGFSLAGIIDIIGNGTNFGTDCVIEDCGITGATISAESITCFNLCNSKWDSIVTITNVYTAGYSGGAGGNPSKGTTVIFDTAKPNAGRTWLTAESTVCGPITTSTNGGANSTVFQGRNGARIGTTGSAHTIGANTQFQLWAGVFIRGTVTNNGVLATGGSFIETLAGAGAVTLLARCSQVKNDSSVSGTSVSDALNTEKGITDTVNNGGVTGSRPASPATYQSYFDTGLSPARPIWWTGAAWVDATGTGV
jgi:hypothetical protein